MKWYVRLGIIALGAHQIITPVLYVYMPAGLLFVLICWCSRSTTLAGAGGCFDALDKLTGEDFENAVAALTDADREAYERRG